MWISQDRRAGFLSPWERDRPVAYAAPHTPILPLKGEGRSPSRRRRRRRWRPDGGQVIGERMQSRSISREETPTRLVRLAPASATSPFQGEDGSSRKAQCDSLAV